MSPLIKKEIRLLLPSWIAALLLAVSSPWFWNDPDFTFGFIAPAILFFGMIILAVDSFGRECNMGTFQLLLSQPIERRQIWRTKITVLLFAAALVFTAYFANCELRLHLAVTDSNSIWHFNPKIIAGDFREAMFASGAVLFVALTGGLWTTLLLRQVAVAFWITLLIPIGLLFLIALVMSQLFGSASNFVVFSVLCSAAGIYSILGFLLAHRLFHHAQDAAWTGGIVDFSRWRYFESGAPAIFSVRRRRPVAALLKKEFQLHSVSLICACALLTVHIMVILMRKVHGHFEPGSLPGTVSEFYWALWLVMPLIIGCTAVAEERRLGVMEGQFCLPSSRRLQFAIKFFPAIISGLLLGGLMPFLLEGLAVSIGAPNPDFNDNAADSIPGITITAGLALGLSLAGIFASTLTKNILQAIGAAVVTIIGCCLFTYVTGDIRGHKHSFLNVVWNPFLTIDIAVLTALVIFPLLTYRNFKYFQERGRMWRRNIWALTGAILFIFISSAALYNRVWEVFEPAEPAHGPAKLSLANPPTVINGLYGSLIVRLPDGRVWFDYLKYGDDDSEANRIIRLWHRLVNPLPESAGAARFVAGSNWKSATVQHVAFYQKYQEGPKAENHVVGYLDTVGIRTDGTLWLSAASKYGNWTGDKMERLGNATNWLQLLPAYSKFLLLKNDGTLWRWGTNHIDWDNRRIDWPSLRVYQPHEIGTNSDWKEIGGTPWYNLARKADGSVWAVIVDGKSGEDEFLCETNLDQVSFPTLSLSGNGAMAYVRPDGTLWMIWTYKQNGTNVYSDFVRVGTETNWMAVAMTWQRIIALKSDGSLWQWHFINWYANPPERVVLAARASFARLGTHNDWVAIANNWEDVIALAADGSLWLWPDRTQYEEQTLLKLPKPPEFLGNIFTGQ